MQLDLRNAFPEFPDLGFLGIIEEHVLCGSVVETDLTGERPLGVVKMAALSLDDPAHLAGIFFFPFRHHVIIRFDFEQAFENERKALGGGFLEGQNLDVVIVHAQMPAMTFDGRFGKVVVEKGVVFEFGEIEFCGMEVEGSLQNAEGLLLVERADSKKVAYLQDEAPGFLKQHGLGISNVLPEGDNLLLGRKMGSQIGDDFFRILRKLCKGASEFMHGLKTLVQHDVIDRQGEERVGLTAEISDAILNRGVYDWAVIELVGDGLVVAFEEILIDAVVFVEQFQSGFETLRETVNRGGVEALVVHTAKLENDTDLAGLCEKDIRPDEAIEIDLLAEGAGLVIVFEDSAKPEHGHL